MLRMTREVYAKLMVLTQHTTEVAAFCITPNDPLYIEDIYIPKQKCTSATFEFDGNDIAEATFDLIDSGYDLWMFDRILIHTHPSNSNTPSSTDWDNFDKIYKDKNFAAMLIIGKSGAISCHAVGRVDALNTTAALNMKVSIVDDFGDLSSEIKTLIEQNVSSPYVKPIQKFGSNYNGYYFDYHKEYGDYQESLFDHSSDDGPALAGSSPDPVTKSLLIKYCNSMKGIKPTAMQELVGILNEDLAAYKYNYIAKALSVLMKKNDNLHKAIIMLGYYLAITGELEDFEFYYDDESGVESAK